MARNDDRTTSEFHRDYADGLPDPRAVEKHLVTPMREKRLHAVPPFTFLGGLLCGALVAYLTAGEDGWAIWVFAAVVVGAGSGASVALLYTGRSIEPLRRQLYEEYKQPFLRRERELRSEAPIRITRRYVSAANGDTSRPVQLNGYTVQVGQAHTYDFTADDFYTLHERLERTRRIARTAIPSTSTESYPDAIRALEEEGYAVAEWREDGGLKRADMTTRGVEWVRANVAEGE